MYNSINVGFKILHVGMYIQLVKIPYTYQTLILPDNVYSVQILYNIFIFKLYSVN